MINLLWGLEVEKFSGSIVELVGDVLTSVLVDPFHCLSLGDVLAD